MCDSWIVCANNNNLFHWQEYYLMINATKKWIVLKFSSIILIPLMIWFIVNFASIYDQGYEEIIAFFSGEISVFLLCLLLITAFFHSALTISEIFEDYVHDEKIKSVANKLLYFFAIIMPLFTITIIIKFSL
tara:strand:- start:218 stop:613 length:396 start_codon:yes stop_codon:yes gene_type:complete